MSLAAWFIEGREGVPYEVIVIAAIVVFNAVLGYVQEAKAAERPSRRCGAWPRRSSGVIRDGRERRVPATEVVRGDILVLAEGDAVAADARLVEAASLIVAEASLTGESEAVLKDGCSTRGAGEHRRPAQHGLQRHGGHPGARARPGDSDRHGN